jgi:hypothetical protein
MHCNLGPKALFVSQAMVPFHVRFSMSPILEDANGFYFVMDGRVYGYWRSKQEAILGRDVEMRRRAR